jgi:hypothetical protein
MPVHDSTRDSSVHSSSSNGAQRLINGSTYVIKGRNNKNQTSPSRQHQTNGCNNLGKNFGVQLFGPRDTRLKTLNGSKRRSSTPRCSLAVDQHSSNGSQRRSSTPKKIRTAAKPLTNAIKRRSSTPKTSKT